MDILDAYVMKTPSGQNALDIFSGEWSSELPAHFGLTTTPGSAKLFEDSRVAWAKDVLGGFEGRRVLEMGPLEGGHSYLLEEAGASEIIAIEANTRAFLKCLCIKEVLGLKRVKFLLGDFSSYLREGEHRFDLVMASGVLYHMDNPVELLDLISRASGAVYLWTHYYDPQIISDNPNLAHKFSPLESFDYQGVGYEIAVQSYKDSLGWSGFCGGSLPTSKWLTRDSLMRALHTFGFTRIEVSFEQPDHPNGPCLALCAMK